ncbi:MAG: hypothetical protein AAB420_01090 [Patescibacteria group bacterium]
MEKGEKLIEAPRSKEETAKAEFAARQAKFKDLIAKAPHFDMLKKLVETYMKTTPIRIRHEDGSISRITGDQIIQHIEQARRNGDASLVPTTLGLREKVKELLKTDSTYKGDKKLTQMRSEEQEQVEQAHKEAHPKFIPDPHIEKQQTLSDVKMQVSKISDLWVFYQDQYNFDVKLPQLTEQQRSQFSRVISFADFATFIARQYKPGRGRKARADLTDFFNKIAPVGTDVSLDFLETLD